MNFTIRTFKVGYAEKAPGPLLFWGSKFKDSFPLDFQVMYIRVNDKNILINTGLTDELMESMNKESVENAGEGSQIVKGIDIETILKTISLNPAEIDYVIITPFQYYSIGNLDIFNNATICLSKRGWIDFFENNVKTTPEKRSIAPRILKYLLFEAWERIRLLEDEDIIVPGVKTFWCGCHHRSSIAIKAITQKGTVIISDCFFKMDNILENVPIGLAEDVYECYSSYSRIKNEADTIISLNDPNNFVRFENGIIVE